MKSAIRFLARKIWNDERGQTIPIVAAALTGLLGMSGLSIDVGNLYTIRAQLQSTTNSAALAAAGSVWNSSSSSSSSSNVATNFLNTYYTNNYGVSFSDGAAHSVSSLGKVSPPTVKTICLNMLMPSGSTCTSTSPKNALRVTQTTSVTPYFMGIFGVHSVSVSATSTASMLGSAQSWNVAIVLDATASMATADSNCSGQSRFQCAEQGIQTLLGVINPCVTGQSSCTPTSNSNFRVALFQSPNTSNNGSAINYTQSASSITWKNQPYTLPIAAPTSSTGYTAITYTASKSGASPSSSAYTATYKVADWTSGYYSASSSSTGYLNTSNPLVQLIGYSNSSGTFVSGSSHLSDSGGESSYHAAAIYAAMASLLAEQTLVSGSANALIFLSDAQAQAASSKFPGAGASVNSTSTTTGVNVATPASSSKNLAGGTKGIYPDFNDECQQTIAAAQAAAAAGIRVYAVAYGSEDSGCTSSGGGTDSALVLTSTQIAALNYNFGAYTNLTPCITMENVASSLSYFYSDYNQSGSGSTCQDSSHTVVSLKDIFLSIAGSLTYPRLLPNDATGYTS